MDLILWAVLIFVLIYSLLVFFMFVDFMQEISRRFPLAFMAIQGGIIFMQPFDQTEYVMTRSGELVSQDYTEVYNPMAQLLSEYSVIPWIMPIIHVAHRFSRLLTRLFLPMFRSQMNS